MAYTRTVTLPVPPEDAFALVTEPDRLRRWMGVTARVDLRAEQEAAHAEGWNHFLGRLEVAAADGDAGPDDWAAAPDPIDELVAAEASLAVLQHVLRGRSARGRHSGHALLGVHGR